MKRVLVPTGLSNNATKAIGIWAWSASRVMDYFEKDNGIDAKKISITGHLRGGKAFLWTAAEDQRFAICVFNRSGSTGAAHNLYCEKSNLPANSPEINKRIIQPRQLITLNITFTFDFSSYMQLCQGNVTISRNRVSIFPVGKVP